MSRKDDMTKYQGFYDGDLDTIYSEFLSRRVSATTKKAKTQIEKREFIYRNYIRFLTDKFVNYLPTHFDFKVFYKDSERPFDSAAEDIKNWLEGPYHGGGKTWWECLPGIYKTDLIFGTQYTKLYVKNGKVHSQKMYSEDTTIVVNPDNVFEVQRIIFEWEKEIEDGDGGTSTVIIKEVVTDKSYQVLQDDQPLKIEEHNFKRIPIIILKFEEVDGSEYGESFIKKLIEPQQNLNLASTMRDWANYKGSYGVYCARDATEGAKITGDVPIVPGTLFKIPIDHVGGNIDMTSVENQLEDYVEEIHNLANIPRRKRLDAISGGVTATEINLIMRDLNEAAKRYISQCRKAFEEILELYYFIQHGADIDVRIDYQDMSMDDKEWSLRAADFVYRIGYTDEAMRKIGYEEEEIKEIKESQVRADAERDINYEAEIQKNANRNEKPKPERREPDQGD